MRLRNQILELLVTQCEQRRWQCLLISHDLPLVAQFAMGAGDVSGDE
ncbi:hypothetical protein ACNKHM_09845 [Shigella sonnei]